MLNPQELPSLESVESSARWRPIAVLSIFASPLLLLLALLPHGSNEGIIPAFLLRAAIPGGMLALILHKWGLLDRHFRTDEKGLAINSLFSRRQIPWKGIDRAHELLSDKYVGRYWEFRVGGIYEQVLITDPYLEASIWQHLRRNDRTGQLPLSPTALTLWELDAARQGVSDPDLQIEVQQDTATYPDLPSLESVQWISSEIYKPIVTALLAVAPFVFVDILVISQPHTWTVCKALVTAMLFQAMTACCAISVWQALKAQGYHWNWMTSPEGIRMLGLFTDEFVPWSDVLHARLSSRASDGWAYLLKTRRGQFTIPLSDNRLEASIWQHLRRHDQALEPEPSERVRSFWQRGDLEGLKDAGQGSGSAIQ